MAQIDVVIPTKDRVELTREAVQSALDQTFDDLRVIVVDDGSTPSVASQLQKLEGARTVVVRRNTSGGQQVARQAGYEASNAPFIALLDSDDLWEPSKLEKQFERFRVPQLPELGAVVSWHAWVRGREVLKESRPAAHGRVGPLFTENMSSPLIARWALQRAEGFLPRWVRSRLSSASNIEFWTRLTAVASVEVVPEVLVRCRVHPNHRASDVLGDKDAAESLAYVVQLHHKRFLDHPDDHARILARVGARFLDQGARGQGYRWLGRSLTTGSARTRGRILKQYGPFAAKQLIWRR